MAQVSEMLGNKTSYFATTQAFVIFSEHFGPLSLSMFYWP